MFRVADKALTPFVSAYLLLLVLMLPLDAYEFLKQPNEYVSVHHIDTSKIDWKFQYLKPNALLFISALAALLLIIFGIVHKRKKKASLLKMIAVFGVAGTIFYGFYQWYLTGFDH